MSPEVTIRAFRSKHILARMKAAPIQFASLCVSKTSNLCRTLAVPQRAWVLGDFHVGLKLRVRHHGRSLFVALPSEEFVHVLKSHAWQRMRVSGIFGRGALDGGVWDEEKTALTYPSSRG